jgi:hypothetical protein
VKLLNVTECLTVFFPFFGIKPHEHIVPVLQEAYENRWDGGKRRDISTPDPIPEPGYIKFGARKLHTTTSYKGRDSVDHEARGMMRREALEIGIAGSNVVPPS